MVHKDIGLQKHVTLYETSHIQKDILTSFFERMIKMISFFINRKIKKMEQEVDLLRPIFVLLNLKKECFDEKWRLVQSRSEKINIQTEVIDPIFSYITDKLNKLSDYLVKAEMLPRI